MEKELEKLKEDKTKSLEEKIIIQRKKRADNDELRKAYEYCKKDSSICLRNAILRANEKANTHSISSIREKRRNIGETIQQIKILPVNQSTNVDEEIRTITKLYSIAYSNQIGNKDNTLGIYEIVISDEEQKDIGYSYRVYSSNIEIEKLKNDSSYRKMFLQSIEKEFMSSSNKEKYIGDVVKESDGKYAIVKDEAHLKAIQGANEIIKNREEEKIEKGETR